MPGAAVPGQPLKERLPMTIKLIFTLLVGLVGGYICLRLKVPGGMMVGAMLASAILGLGFDMAYMPTEAKVVAQIVAGAFIAAGMEKNDLLHMRHIPRPIFILLGSMLALNLIMGFLVHFLCGIDLATALYCAVPGGVSDMPIIAADAGANSGIVALVQLSRLITGIGLFPALIAKASKAESREILIEERQKTPPPPKTAGTVALTLAVATGCGLLGRLSGMPAGTMLFSLLGVLVLKVAFNRAWLPLYIRRGAQVLSGCYIGNSITRGDLLGFKSILWPILLVLAGYTVACFLISAALKRFTGMTRREGMLAAIPAGATDIALISSDLGVTSPDLIVLQIVRMLGSIILFPQVINLILRLAA